MKRKLLQHYTAGAFIFSDSSPAKVLLVHHKQLGTWLEPGGHQHEDENPLEAMVREVKEETGLDITPYAPVLSPIDQLASFIPLPRYLLQEKIAAHGAQPEHYHLDQIYCLRIPEQAVRHNRRESHAVRWFTREELRDIPMFENARVIVEEEMQQL